MAEKALAAHAITQLLATLRPNPERVARDVLDFQRAHPRWDRATVASAWADRACWIYAGQGAASALPGAIPGLGTATQVAIEGGVLSADLALMVRLMSGMTMGVGIIYERDVETDFNAEFVRVMGLWCGALSMGRDVAIRLGTKVAVAQFNRHVPAEVFRRINQKVGTTILSKYGTTRGGIAVGRLVPFGVGVVVGGGFNLVTMKAFKKAALRYFAVDEPEMFVETSGEPIPPSGPPPEGE